MLPNRLCLCLIGLLLVAFASSTFAETKKGGVVVETRNTAKEIGECAIAGDVLTVHYVGRLRGPEGKEFDSSRGTRKEPLVFPLGKGTVIQAWEVGMEGLCVGQTRTILAPPEMAYGERGFQNVIPPHSTLWFEVELMSLSPGPAHPRSLNMNQVLILVPVLLVVGALGYFGFKLMSSKAPAPSTPKNKKKDK